MKQHITREQFNELSLSAKKKLYTYFFGKPLPVTRGGFYSIRLNAEYLTIGRMIEFLVAKRNSCSFSYWKRAEDLGGGFLWCVSKEYDGDNEMGVEWCEDMLELCDALWEAIKRIL